MMLKSWATWVATVLASVQAPAPIPEPEPEPICTRLVEHLGPDQVAYLNAQRPAFALKVSQVCVRVVDEARHQGIDPTIAAAVAYAESGMRWETPGKAFIGPMQVGRKWCKVPERSCLPDGVQHLQYWYSISKNWKRALWGYVGGHTPNLSEKRMAHKQHYVGKVMKLVSVLSPKKKNKRAPRDD